MQKYKEMVISRKSYIFDKQDRNFNKKMDLSKNKFQDRKVRSCKRNNKWRRKLQFSKVLQKSQEIALARKTDIFYK